MIPDSVILACLATLFVAVILPIVLPVALAAKNKGKAIPSAWFLGAAGFFVTQILIRIPILMALSSLPGFTAFARNHLGLYAFALAFTAGLVELAGRFVVAKCLRKNLTFPRALAAGLGHGGIEAISLIGSAYVTNLVLIFLINSGGFDALLAEVAAAGMDASQIALLRDTLLSTAPALFLLGGFERILAMICHAAMSMLVCWGVKIGKTLPCALVCLGIHTLIDLTAGLSALGGTVLSQTTVYVLIYSLLTVAAACSLWILGSIHRRWTSLA